MESRLLPTLKARSTQTRAGARLEIARRGSVLILVVALLVLMALLGTAYISTTRVDRATSAQHTKNVQIDLLVDGVVNQVASAIRSDLYDANGNYRPADSATVHTTNYEHFDSYGVNTPYDVSNGGQIDGTSPTVAHDEFIAQRLPWTLDPTKPYAAGTNPPVWRGVSYPVQQVNSSTLAQGINWQFNSPDGTTTFDLQFPYRLKYGAAPTGNFTGKPWFVPTRKEVLSGSGIFYPAFTAYAWDPTNTAAPLQGPTFIAADVDGDGVADSGLTKLPIGTINGVTYYVGVRILDNNSAVNINTAWSNKEFDGSGSATTNLATPYPGRYYTPASIGLAELLRTTNITTGTNIGIEGTEIKALFDRRFNKQAPVDGVQGTSGTQPHQDDGTNIPFNQYQSLQDALQQTVGVRPSNPGTITNSVIKSQPFSITDSMALAYHFGLLNPDASPSTFESVVNLPGDSFYQGAPNYGSKWSSYAVSTAGLNNWYEQNFDVAKEVANTPSSFLQRRSMVVASSPVSWQAPAHTVDVYAQNAGLQQYLYLAPVGTTVSSLAKTSINQAPFLDLWRAFWNAMVEDVTIPTGTVNAGTVYRGSPFDLRILYTANGPGATLARLGSGLNVDPPTFNNPYLGMSFLQYDEVTSPATSYLPPNKANPASESYDPSKPMATSPPAAPTDYHPARMFRSSIRAIPDPALVTGTTPGFNAATPRLSAQQMVLLRSAIAAVNAEDLRDSDDDVTAKRIVLTPTNGGTVGSSSPGIIAPAEAIVYGNERQPFITEIYVDTDTEYAGTAATPLLPNPYGYVAIELYNPYSEDIVLKNWKLAALDRRSQVSVGQPAPPYSNAALTRTGAVAPNTQYNLVLDQSALIADFDPMYGSNQVYVGGTTAVTADAPLIVPAKGYLLLENYYDPGTYPNGTLAGSPPTPSGPLSTAIAHYAGHRPAVTGLPVNGPITQANAGNDRSTPLTTIPVGSLPTALRVAPLPRLNVASVPGLSGLIDLAWGPGGAPEWPTSVRSVMNRELVLLRPRRADGNYSTGVYPPIVLANTTLPARAYDERPNIIAVSPPGVAAGEVPYSHLRDLVPVDSFDFTGLKLPQPVGPGTPLPPEPLGRALTDPLVHQAAAWHYARQNVDAAGGLPNWKFVYPGRYSALSPTAAGATVTAGPLTGDPVPRQQGTQYTGWANNNPNPWEGSLTAPVPVSGTTTVSWFTFGTGTSGVVSNENIRASYPTTFRISLAFNNYTRETNTGLATTDIGRNTIGESPMNVSNNAPPNRFPFGGFAREGDILATPFIGAYTIRYLNSTGGPLSTFTIAEMNAITTDSAFAEDTDIHDDPDPTDETAPNNGTIEREEVGRFCPVRVLATASALDTPDYKTYPAPYFTAGYAAPSIAVNDFGFDPSYNPTTPTHGCDWEPYWRYHWAADLLDYLSVRSPADDYLPNYPMQREWRGTEPTLAGSPQEMYYRGDMVSFYNPTSTFWGTPQPAHEIYVCTTTGAVTSLFPPGNASFTLAFAARPVKNTSDTDAAFRGGTYAQQHTEDNVPVDGLININTANWKVLSTLPLIVNPLTGVPDDNAAAYGLTYRQLNQEMAKAIEYYRDVDGNEDPAIIQPHGPFRSIFELNRVVDLRPGHPTVMALAYPAGTLPGFQNGYGTLPIPNTPLPAEADDSLGDLGPVNVGATLNPDGVRGDYKERFLQLTRISNLITTRSDSFTCYILVQGWRNAETTNAQLVVQRRVGYIIDRSRITPTTPDKLLKQAFVNN